MGVQLHANKHLKTYFIFKSFYLIFQMLRLYIWLEIVEMYCYRKKINGKEEILIIEEREVKKVESILDLGLRHKEQIEILRKLQDEILKLQSVQLAEKIDKDVSDEIVKQFLD